jgi:hypothetical protein
MNYTKKKYDEARRRFIDGQPWDKIVEVFATVPQVTLEEASNILSDYHERYSTGEKDLRDAVNVVLAKHGPVIAAKPADGMVTTDTLDIAKDALQEIACFGNGALWGNSRGNMIAIRALKKIGSPTKPEPTVTLVDAAEGRTLEVPASAVHEMEYPEAVTYTRDPWTGKDMCNLCGVYVVDKVTHAAFHGRMEGK